MGLMWVNVGVSGVQKEPTPTARPKYSTKGGYSAKSFARLGLPASIVVPLMQAANHSLAANTWTSYATAERHIARVEKATGVRLTFPFSLKSTLAYVGYLLSPKSEGGRGLQGKSVEKYLSALRSIHMLKGHFDAWLRPEIVKEITKGAATRDQLNKRLQGKTGKHAMTPEIMWELKQRLSKSNITKSKRRIIWAVSTICWAGAFRIHELLARAAGSYCRMTTMTAGDITVEKATLNGVKVDILKVHLKHPKEERLSAGVTIDCFPSGDFMCPVTAFLNWKKDKVCKLSTQKPLFRLANGENYTGTNFNRDLKSLLKEVVDYEVAPITSHSFRRGLATFMRKQGCYSDEEIMRIGRWHSRAFEAYIIAPREVRARLAAELATRVAQAVQLS